MLFILRLFFLALIGLPLSLYALDARLSLKLGEADQELKQVENLLTLIEGLDPGQLELNIKRALEAQNIAEACVLRNEQTIQALANDLELLGTPADSDPPELLLKRTVIEQGMLGDAQQLASCRLMMLRSEEAQRQLNDRLSLVLQQELLHQNLPLHQLVELLTHQSERLLPELPLPPFPQVQMPGSFWWLFFFNLVLLGLWGFNRQLLKQLQQYALNQAQDSLWRGPPLAFTLCLRRYLSAFVILGGAWIQLGWFMQASLWLDFIYRLLLAALLYTLLRLLLRLLFRPCKPAQSLWPLETQHAAALARHGHLLGGIVLAGGILFEMMRLLKLPDFSLQLALHVYLPLLALPLSALFWRLGAQSWMPRLGRFRLLGIILLWGLVLTAWSGYQNLAVYLLAGLLGSLSLLLGLFALSKLSKSLFDSLDEGQGHWQQRLRQGLNLKPKELLPGSVWFRLGVGISLWFSFIFLSLQLWGVPDSQQQQFVSALTDGFQLGDIQIVPSRILVAIMVLALLLSVVSWAKQSLQQSWLQRIQMERGSKEAIISLTGYFGLIVAVLFALSVAGFEMANLALIAGALSVGIGFGLQNIFNNFVSGLILLFERPIKTGDWVEVGTTQGVVRKISIRSTIIQTWDRADVIVPNSELISSQVINWMYKDAIGRVTIPVGVAYDADPEQVKQILLQIARELPLVIHDSPVLPNPWVLFRGLGESSLDFELRAFISPIDEKLGVESQANFAIIREFRKAGIEIPYPQRDLHIRSSVIGMGKEDEVSPDTLKMSDSGRDT